LIRDHPCDPWPVFYVSCYDIHVPESLDQADYQALAELRYQIRRFLSFSEHAARKAGLEPRQHQLLLALKGLPPGARPRIRELAERLQLAHHSTVELANRLAKGGYIRRAGHGDDRREVLLALTPKGERVLLRLSLHHQEELKQLGPELVAALDQVMHSSPLHRSPKSSLDKRGKA
jgi:DNA-binding MarR family transcriptional regulator